MIKITLPNTYKRLPLPEYYFVRSPEFLAKHLKPEHVQNIQLLQEYVKISGKEYSELSDDELWMFEVWTPASGKTGRVNNHYQHFLDTGEVLPYDGPGPNLDEHKDIFLRSRKIDKKYGVPEYVEDIPYDAGEEIRFSYGGKNKIEKFSQDNKLIWSTENQEQGRY